jgi:hypothetical protein
MQGQSSYLATDFFKGNFRSIWFDIYSNGDSLLLGTINRFAPNYGRDEPYQFTLNFQGSVLDSANLTGSLTTPVSISRSWSNSNGYLHFYDTTAVAAPLTTIQNRLYRKFEYRSYTGDSLLWEGDGPLGIPSLNEFDIYVSSDSCFWGFDYINQNLVSYKEVTGDTTAIFSCDSFINQFLNLPGYRVGNLYLKGNRVKRSDTVLGLLDLIKRDTAGNVIDNKSFYSFLDLKGLQVIGVPSVWSGQIRVNQDATGFLEDSNVVNIGSLTMSKVILNRDGLTGRLDTLFVVDSLSIDPDFANIRTEPYGYIFLQKGEYSLYVEDIERRPVLAGVPFFTIDMVRIRLYKKNRTLYTKILSDTIQSFEDTFFQDAFLDKDGRAVVELDIGYLGRGARLVFIDTTGENYLDLKMEEKLSKQWVEIYPTVVKDEITIKSDKLIRSFVLLNAIGETIFRMKPIKNEFMVSLITIDPGSYIVKIESQDGLVETKRLLVK